MYLEVLIDTGQVAMRDDAKEWMLLFFDLEIRGYYIIGNDSKISTKK
jgi:hypothetical protein